jgi:hypothetical protein
MFSVKGFKLQVPLLVKRTVKLLGFKVYPMLIETFPFISVLFGPGMPIAITTGPNVSAVV